MATVAASSRLRTSRRTTGYLGYGKELLMDYSINLRKIAFAALVTGLLTIGGVACGGDDEEGGTSGQGSGGMGGSGGGGMGAAAAAAWAHRRRRHGRRRRWWRWRRSADDDDVRHVTCSGMMVSGLPLPPAATQRTTNICGLRTN